MQSGIAIIGISTELPSSSWSDRNLDHPSFFEFLLDHGQAYERIPSERFDIDAWKGHDLGQIFTEQGSFLKGAQLFDNMEFSVSSKDARNMSPGTRKLIENAFLALLDSGIDYRSRTVGCFASSTNHPVTNISDMNEYEVEGSFAGIPAMVANKISYHLDLLGPSVPTDTACSSSATALHLAVSALNQGDCEAAVVAGAQINNSFIDWFLYSQGSVLAPDGKCKPFDASADGFSRAEGVVAIVIKPLQRALSDGDYIYGTIMGSAINTGGNAAPPAAPIPEAQRRAMQKAFERAGLLPTDVDYVECHATGTSVGDPAEANWIAKNFGRDDPLFIGSVKGNIGHSEITAFLASLSKVVSMFHHQIIPPNANLTRPNPAIPWKEYNMIAPTISTRLPCRSGNQSIVAIASSGIGGSNAHVVVQSPPPHTTPSVQSQEWPILLLAGGLSPRTATVTASSAMELALAHPENQRLLAVKFARRTRQMAWRTFAILDALTPSSKVPHFPAPTQCPRTKPPIVFVFSGQGPQHVNMGRQFFSIFPAFRSSVLESDEAFKTRTGYSLINDIGLFGDKPPKDDLEEWPIHIALPALLIFQIALYDLLLDLGVRPDVLIGHSAGETALVYASQAGSRALAVELAIARGQAFSSVEAFGGTMAALSCSAAKARELISKVSSEDTGAYPVDIACYNAPEAVAISGPSDQIDKIISLARDENIAGRKIRTRTPVHSSMIEICKDKYVRSVEDVFRRNGGTSNPQILTYSTCHGDLFNQPFDTDYFWNNARRPVVFRSTMETLCSRYRNAVFVEISAHPVLSAYINEVGVPVSHTLAGARRSKAPVEYRAFLQTVGQLTLAGYNSVRFDRLNFCNDANFDLPVKLPEYPFMRKSFPFYFDGPVLWKQHEARNGPLNHKYLGINQRTHPWLSDHKALGEAIMPACGFVEMALEFGATVLMEVNFRKILPTAREKPVPVHVDLDGSYWSVKSNTSGKNVDLHADGYLSFETVPCSHSMPIIDIIRSRSEHITHDEFYASIGGLEYGPIFRRVLDMYINPREALVKVKGYTPDVIKDGPFHVHPAILDCCIQAVEHFHGDSDPDSYYLPSRIKNVVLHKSMRNSKFPEIFYVYHNLHLWQPDSVVVNITIFDEEGVPVCTMQEFEIRRHRLIQESGVKRRYDIVYQPISLPVGSFLKDDVDKKELSHPKITAQGMFETTPGDPKPVEEQGDVEKMEMMQRILKRTLASIAFAPGRVVNIIFITTDGNSLHSQVSAVFDHHRSFYINYFISNGSKLTTTTWNTTARVDALSLDQPIASQGFSSNSFDLLYLIEPENFEAIPFSVITQTAQSLLTDMGHLFLIGTESHMPGRVSCLTQRGFERLGSFSAGSNQFQTAEFILHQQMANNSKDVRYVRYKCGHESDLISTLRGYDTAENCDIWIIADEGREGDEATGLVRTIRKEFLTWNMKLAVFAASFSEERRTNFLKNFALGLRQETEIVVSSEGDVTVPRIFPLPSSDTPNSFSLTSFSRLLKGHVLVRATARSAGGAYSSFVGSVIASSSSDFTTGCTVMGITTSAEAEFAVSSLSLRPLDSLSLDAVSIISRLPGLVVAVLAPTLNIFSHPKRLSQWRVLLTHATSSIGRVVRGIYRARQVDIVEVAEDITLYQLSQIGREEFDLVITGYVDPSYLHVLDLLIRRDVGRIFTWNTGHTSLARICVREPWQIGDAIEVGFCNAPPGCEFPAPDIDVRLPVEPFNKPLAFRPDCNYLILGGLGSLGPHIALWMYERGARHMILTSRQATTTFPPCSDRQSRIIHYLKSRSDLTLRFESFDPAKAGRIYESFSAISPPIAGCFILTAMPSDGLSLNLTSDDFKRSHSASLDVFRTLQSIVNVDEMDFLVHFSSVSALCGNAGQSSYASAKTALDGELARFKNAFAFVCPAISGTKLVNSLYSVRSASSLLSWQVSPSRMLQWLDDAMRVLRSGNEMRYYIPDWDWEDAAKALGLPAFGTYLCPPKSAEQGSTTLDDNDRRITEVITQQLDVHPEDLSDDVSLASYGLDSLSASRLSFTLRKVFGLKISQIQLLADITTGDIRGKVTAQEKESQMVSPLDRIRHEMMNRLQKYTLGSVKHVAKNSAQPAKRVVLVTGTTGALGANILHQLVLDPSVGTIYAMNRPSGMVSITEKQTSMWRKQGLPENLVRHSKIRNVAYDIAAERLGLDNDTIAEITSSVTHIIHNAWKSDFSLALSAYDDLMKGTRSLIDLALSSQLAIPPTFAFISTTGVCQFNTCSVPCPEVSINAEQLKTLEKDQPSDHTGYIQSKWVSEQIVEHFRATTPLKASIIRVGQLASGPNGNWDIAHWFPALVKSGFFLDCLPAGDDVVTWLPVQTAAGAVVDLMDTDGTVHVVHPRPVSWKMIMQTVATTVNIPLVPYADWFRRLEASVEGGTRGNANDNPAIKLLDFYRQGVEQASRCAMESMGLLSLASTERAKSLSPTLRGAEAHPLSEEDVRGWMDYWRRVGYLPSRQ